MLNGLRQWMTGTWFDNAWRVPQSLLTPRKALTRQYATDAPSHKLDLEVKGGGYYTTYEKRPDATDTGLSRHNILVLVNNTDMSRSVADYYMSARRIPAVNMLSVDVDQYSTDDTAYMSEEDAEVLWGLIEAHIDDNDLDIRCLLLMPDFVLGVGTLLDSTALEQWLSKRSGGGYLGQSNPYFLATHEETPVAPVEQLQLTEVKHYTASLQATTGLNGCNGMILACRLDGPNETIIKGLIDKAIAADGTGLPGTWYFDWWGDDPTNEFNDVYRVWDAEQLGNLGNWDPPATVGEDLGRTVVQQTTGTTRMWEFTDGDAGFYIGWYTWPPPAPIPTSRAWADGAIGIEINSSGMKAKDPAWRFAMKDAGSYAGKMLSEGITATCGAIAEPSTAGFPEMKGFLQGLLAGLTLVEAYSMTTIHIASWRVVWIGDPLYRPFGV
ncbi:MAG: TIGR03790 family protein [bacterium]